MSENWQTMYKFAPKSKIRRVSQARSDLSVFFSRHVYFPAQPVRAFTLNRSSGKAVVTVVLPSFPRNMTSVLLRLGFSVPGAPARPNSGGGTTRSVIVYSLSARDSSWRVAYGAENARR